MIFTNDNKNDYHFKNQNPLPAIGRARCRTTATTRVAAAHFFASIFIAASAFKISARAAFQPFSPAGGAGAGLSASDRRHGTGP
jgi:hypothetical protein